MKTLAVFTGLLLCTVASLGQSLNPPAVIGFAPVTTPTILTVGPECSASHPCNVRADNTTVGISTTATLQIVSGSSGDATIYYYVLVAGGVASEVALYQVTSGSVTFSPTNCVATSTGTAPSFPQATAGTYAFPVAIVNVVSGAFTTPTDERAGATVASYAAGSGIDAAEASGITTLSIDPDYSPTTQVPNSSSGTVINTLTKLTGAPSTAVEATTSDTGGVIGITVNGAGATGTATIQQIGQASCVFDSHGTTAGDYVQISSSTGGDCTDAGSSFPTSGGQVLGRALSTNSGAGTYTMLLFGPEIKASGGTIYTWTPVYNGASGAVFAGTATNIRVFAISGPDQPLSFSDASFDVNTVGTGDQSFGIAGPCAPGASSCSVICSTTAQTLTSGAQSLSCSGSISPAPSGEYYYLLTTSTDTTAKYLAAGDYMNAVCSASSTSAPSGVIPSTIAIPSATSTWINCTSVPMVAFHN